MDQGSIAIVVDGCAVEIAQPFDARDVLHLGGILGDGIVIRVDRGRTSRFAPEAPIAFAAGARPVFRTFRGAPQALWVDGLRWDWGSPVISEADIRAISGTVPGSVRFEEGGGPLRPGVLLNLTTGFLWRLRTRSPDAVGAHVPGTGGDGTSRPRQAGSHVLVRVDGFDVVLSRARLTGAAVLASAGAADADSAVLIRVDGGHARQIGANEHLEVAPGCLANFRVHSPGERRRFEVDGRTWEWGSPVIDEAELLDIVLDGGDREGVVLVSEAVDVRLGTLIDLAADGSTRIVSHRLCSDDLRAAVGSTQSSVWVSSTTSKS